MIWSALMKCQHLGTISVLFEMKFSFLFCLFSQRIESGRKMIFVLLLLHGSHLLWRGLDAFELHRGVVRAHLLMLIKLVVNENWCIMQ